MVRRCCDNYGFGILMLYACVVFCVVVGVMSAFWFAVNFMIASWYAGVCVFRSVLL